MWSYIFHFDRMRENDSVKTVVIARSGVDRFKFIFIFIDGATVNSRGVVLNAHKPSLSYLR